MFYVLSDNISWMTFNVLLALIPVFLGWLVYLSKSKLLKIIFFIGWILFVPNTIYIFTDILHLIKQINRVDMLGEVILLVQYTFLFFAGFLTYIFALYPIEKMLTKQNKKKKKRNVSYLIIGINFLIGFAMVLGRVQRLNSWDLFVAMEKVVYATVLVLSSPKMISLAILFGLLANFIYFLFKRETVRHVYQLLKKTGK